jgi:hypothetical protein
MSISSESTGGVETIVLESGISNASSGVPLHWHYDSIGPSIAQTANSFTSLSSSIHLKPKPNTWILGNAIPFHRSSCTLRSYLSGSYTHPTPTNSKVQYACATVINSDNQASQKKNSPPNPHGPHGSTASLRLFELCHGLWPHDIAMAYSAEHVSHPKSISAVIQRFWHYEYPPPSPI